MAKKATTSKKGTTGKKSPGQKKSVKTGLVNSPDAGEGLSEDEHGQAWERDEHVAMSEDESEPGDDYVDPDEDDTDPEDKIGNQFH